MHLVIGLLTLVGSLLVQDAPVAAEWPLVPGGYWVYAGNVAWVPAGGTAVERRALIWRMEVTDLVEREFAVVAVVTGHPRDLIAYQPGREPRTSLIVRVNGGRHYLVGPDRAPAVLKRFRDPADNLVGMVRESEVVLQTPVALGQRFCETESMARADGLDCWWVDQLRNPGEPITGAPAGWDGTDYAMAYRSPAWSEFIGFAPGVGVTSYDHSSPSTRSEVQLTLMEVGRRPIPPPSTPR